VRSKYNDNLLALVESMDFVNEEYRLALAQPLFILCLPDDLADVGRRGTGRRVCDKARVTSTAAQVGNDMCQGCLQMRSNRFLLQVQTNIFAQKELNVLFKR